MEAGKRVAVKCAGKPNSQLISIIPMIEPAPKTSR
jgi:hypothetical protein